MMRDSHGLFNMMRIHASSNQNPFQITIGELSQYDPETHSAQFELVLFLDASGNPIPTGFIPIATPYAGPTNSNPQGAQFPLATGTQALIIYLDRNSVVPIVALPLFNEVDVPPFTDGKTYGWLDPNGVYVKTTDDTKGKGVRLGGEDYGSLVATLVELGAEGLSNPNGVVRYKDLQVVVNAFNTFISVFNSHFHSGVTTGGGNTLQPTQQGTTTNTQSSNTVRAAD